MIHTAFFLSHFFQYHYAPAGQPWYTGAIWSNVVAVTILAPCGYLWAKTKFWPLNRIHTKLDRLHEHHSHTHQGLADIHAKLDELHEKVDTLQGR